MLQVAIIAEHLARPHLRARYKLISASDGSIWYLVIIVDPCLMIPRGDSTPHGLHKKSK